MAEQRALEEKAEREEREMWGCTFRWGQVCSHGLALSG